jgi:predicted amidophosphoribosyltransferase
MLLGSTCVVCRHDGGPVCRRCAAGLELATPTVPPRGVDGWTALFVYDPGARAVITSLKNGHRRDLVAWLADRMVERRPPPTGAVVTWAPTGARRRGRRGFDQAELLARALARRWGLPCRSTLRRAPGPPQAGRRGAQRRANPAFGVRGPAPKAVLLVDDVATTGATLTAAARALRVGGAVEVRAVVVAHAAQGIRSWT